MVQQHSSPTPQERRLAQIGALIQGLREEDRLDAALQTVVNYVSQETEFPFVWIGLYSRSEHCLLSRAMASPNERRLFTQERLAIDPGDIFEQVVVGLRPLSIANLAEERSAGRWGAIAQTHHIQGAVLYPLRHRDACEGVVLLASPHWAQKPKSDEKLLLLLLLGQLGETLHRLRLTQSAHQLQGEEVVFQLLQSVRGLDSFTEQLEQVVYEVHQSIGPSQTSVYWFEPEGRYFWRRLASPSSERLLKQANRPGILIRPSRTDGQGESLEIPVSDCPNLYHTLNRDQMVTISDPQSILNAEVPIQLLQRLQAESLLIAPIRHRNELLGFLAAEGNAPRTWRGSDKRLLQGAAQVLALCAPLDALDQSRQRSQQDQSLSAQLGRMVHSEQSWQDTLRGCADSLMRRFQAERLCVLSYDAERHQFELLFQTQAARRKRLPLTSLPNLNELDWRLLSQHTGAIAIEDWGQDLRLLGWREALRSAGLTSLLVARTSLEGHLEGVLMLGTETPRAWNTHDQTLWQSIAQQLGSVLQQRQIQSALTQQQRLYQSLQWGLAALQREKNPTALDQVGLQAIAQVLQAGWAGLVSWSHRVPVGTLSASHSNGSSLSLAETLEVHLASDPIVQQLQVAKAPVLLSAPSLPPETQRWLKVSAQTQILCLPLQTWMQDTLQGMVVVLSLEERTWTERERQLAGALSAQLAWSRRSLTLVDHFQANQIQLQQVNWYKQYCGEDLQRALQLGLQRLRDTTQGDSERHLQTLDQALQQWQQILEREEWHLQPHPQAVSLNSFLKRAMDRLDPVLKRHQLWSQIHGNDSSYTLQIDPLKTEGIFYEVLVAACERCLAGGRLDIWCRRHEDVPSQPKLEITVTDNGFIDPLLMRSLQPDADLNDIAILATLERSPGLQLHLCGKLLDTLGGSLTFVPLDDGRVMSQLLLPLVR